VSKLLPEVQMHIKADELCKRARTCRNQTVHYKMPANEVNFVLNEQTVNANVPKATMIAYHNINLRAFMKRKFV
jgi:hypothetical protein